MRTGGREMFAESTCGLITLNKEDTGTLCKHHAYVVSAALAITLVAVDFCRSFAAVLAVVSSSPSCSYTLYARMMHRLGTDAFLLSGNPSSCC
jgi:hypothetical protein